jgi:DNA invertase Pin-like site-specific DNA recombinase
MGHLDRITQEPGVKGGKACIRSMRVTVGMIVGQVGAGHTIDETLADAGTPSGRFFFHVMARLAEMERELTVERTRAGLEVARQPGRKGGRKPKMTDSKIESAKKLLAGGIPPRDVAKNLGVSIPTLYRWVPASAHA